MGTGIFAFFCTVCFCTLRNVYFLVSALTLIIRILPLKSGNYLRNIRPRTDCVRSTDFDYKCEFSVDRVCIHRASG